MKKKKSKLQLAQARAEEALKATNEKIEELGQHTSKLYDALTSIQERFDAIRNIPSESKLEYEELKKIRIEWKQQAKKIEDDYRNSTIKGGGAGAAGAAAGVAVAALGPTAAMGIATTFGVASTGTAIAALHGAAAANAALAWLGGGALAAGGGGMAAGNALLALAGPVGWAIAGVALLSSGLFLWKATYEKKRLENVFTLISERDITSYELALVELNERITRIENETALLNASIAEIDGFGLDYRKMTEQQQYSLGSYVNLMRSSTQLLVNPILGLQPKCTAEDLDDSLIGSARLNFSDAQKSLIVMLANLLYKIDFNDKDKKLLLKTFQGNKKMLEAMKLTKKDLDGQLFDAVQKLLKICYEKNSIDTQDVNSDKAEYFCPNCGAILNAQKGFDPDDSTWTCLKCGQFLFDEGIEGEEMGNMVWYCDQCGDLLNKQDGFTDMHGEWKCLKCGHIERFTEIIDVQYAPELLRYLSDDEGDDKGSEQQ